MPLDVQPLSPARRALMLLVLLAIFGASVAFAQILVARVHTVVAIAWNFPSSFKTVPLDQDEPEEVQIRAVGKPMGHERLLRGIAFDLPSKITVHQQLDLMEKIFATLSDAQTTTARPAPLANRPGLELEGVSDDGEFTLLRMIATPGRAIAISYSGAEKLTDWDRLYFNNLCQRVVLHGDTPTKRK